MDQLITILQNQSPYTQNTPIPQQTIISQPQQFILSTPTFNPLNPPPLLTYTLPQPQTQTIYPTSHTNTNTIPPTNIILVPMQNPQTNCKQLNTNINNLNLKNISNISNISNNTNVTSINIPKATTFTEHNPTINNNINDINIQNVINYMLQQCIQPPAPISSIYSLSPSTTNTTTIPKLETDTCKTSKQPQSCYCATCGKHFKNTHNLLVHEKKQHAHFPTCPFCGKEFVHRGNLKQHIRTHLQKNIAQNAFQQRFKNSCGENVNNVPDKCYKCPVCFKAFSKQLLMMQHKQIHNGLKQYVCTICNSSYGSRSAQSYHMKNVHPLVWETIKHRLIFKGDK